MKQRILVIGGGGFIGRRIVAALTGEGAAQVVAAGRRAPAVPAGVEALALDATDGEALRRQLGDFDAVVNCMSGRAAAIQANAQALNDAAIRHRTPPLLVHLSSMAVYGDVRGRVDESVAPHGRLAGYAAAKLAAEQAISGYARRVVLRPGCVYGAGSPQWSERIAHLLIARRVGDLGAAGDGYCNLVHVDDVAAAVLQSLRRSQAEGCCYNLAMPEPPTWNEYFARFARVLGAVPLRRVSARRLQVESRVLAPVLKGAELLARMAGGVPGWLPPAIPPSLLALWRQEIRLDARRAQIELGVEWKPLEQGLRESVAALRRSSAVPATA